MTTTHHSELVRVQMSVRRWRVFLQIMPGLLCDGKQGSNWACRGCSKTQLLSSYDHSRASGQSFEMLHCAALSCEN